ncbi:MAG: FAD-dependent oxidoreductase [Firmicutes bacterium]|nr:FAD-dependent oxidoreductase [Bacillota bacterium]
MKTIWKSEMPDFKPLLSNVECDVAIIGGGIAGLWCAYKLSKKGKRVCVLEAKSVGSGVTKGSSAILTYAHDDIYHQLIKKHDTEVARKYLHDAKRAIKGIVKVVKDENWDIDLEPIDYVLFSKKWGGKRRLGKEIRAYGELGIDIPEIVPDLPYGVRCAIKCGGSYQFNPLKLVSCLADVIKKNGGKIFENTMVTEAPDGNELRVNEFAVRAKDFVVATHFPYINLPGFYWLKMYQEQNYCIVIGDKGCEDFCVGTSYESIDQKGFEYRRVGNKILIDGATVRTGQKPYRSKYQILEKHINRFFPNAKEYVRYSAQDCMTLDLLPYAGRYSHFADNIFVVSGFNKWGMTGAYVTSDVVVDMIMGKMARDANFKENIYSPQRNVLVANIIDTVQNVGVIAASFANDLLNLDAKKFERIKPGQGAVIKYKGHRVGASRDEKGKVRLVSAICPHLGCNLKWNKDDLTWDCPCHGSRFDTDGNVLNNPAIEGCKKVK